MRREGTVFTTYSNKPNKTCRIHLTCCCHSQTRGEDTENGWWLDHDTLKAAREEGESSDFQIRLMPCVEGMANLEAEIERRAEERFQAMCDDAAAENEAAI